MPSNTARPPSPVPQSRKVPPPGPDDVYLFVNRPEAVRPSVFTVTVVDHPGPVTVRDRLLVVPPGTLRLTPYDQRFLKKFGIRVP